MWKNRLKQIMKQTRVLSNVFAHDIWEYCVGAPLYFPSSFPGPLNFNAHAFQQQVRARFFALSAIYRPRLEACSCRLAAVSAAALSLSHRPTAEGEWDQLEQHWIQDHKLCLKLLKLGIKIQNDGCKRVLVLGGLQCSLQQCCASLGPRIKESARGPTRGHQVQAGQWRQPFWMGSGSFWTSRYTLSRRIF